ncbi:MAG: hypothetical protein ACU0CA_06065 [Paracoccaceae bacterium]
MKNKKQSVEQNSASIETIAGQLVAMQLLLETVIIDGIRSGALSSDLFTAAIGQAMENFPKNKNLSSNELFGAIGTFNSALEAITVATIEKMPE